MKIATHVGYFLFKIFSEVKKNYFGQGLVPQNLFEIFQTSLNSNSQSGIHLEGLHLI
jgi:hypothetical protein